jgi:putative transcriptional regulator
MIATRLEELLSERERTLYWLAKESGVGYKTLHKLARGRADSIKFDILDKICTLLECSPGDVLVQASESERNRGKRRR